MNGEDLTFIIQYGWCRSWRSDGILQIICHLSIGNNNHTQHLNTTKDKNNGHW